MTPPSSFDPQDAYRIALFLTRRRFDALTITNARTIQQAIAAFADQLAARVAALPASDPGRAAAIASEYLERVAAKQLQTALERAIAEGREVTFEEILAIWRTSAERVFKLVGVPNAALGAVRSPPISLLGTMEQLSPAGNWKTLLRGHVTNAAGEAQAIIRQGLLEGISTEQLARRLRYYVRGAQSFHALFTDVDGTKTIDLASIPRAQRGQARQMTFNARRIAYSELANARHEANLQHFTADPLIWAVAWRTARDRGTQVEKDECDILRDTNFFGLGPGIYPLNAVPPLPHPFDRSVAAWTPVLTTEGWRPVQEVAPGDRVLTHKGRWRPVLESIHGRTTDGWMSVRTQDGRRLLITEEHPVRLASGEWRPAGLLGVGDLVVASQNLPSDPVGPDVDCGPIVPPVGLPVEDPQSPRRLFECAPLSDVLPTLLPRPVPTAVDLDCDAVGWDGEVDVVATEWKQRDDGDASIDESIPDFTFDRAETLVPEHGQCPLPARLICLGAAGKLQVSPDGAGQAFLPGHTRADENVGFNLGPWRDPCSYKVAADHASGDTEMSRDSLLTPTIVDVKPLQLCLVQVDAVTHLSVHLRRYCLTVAQDSSFVAGGVVVHNCHIEPQVRPASQATQAKPRPPLQLDPAQASTPGLDRLSPTARDRALTQAKAAVLFGQGGGWNPGAGRTLAERIELLMSDQERRIASTRADG